MTSISSITAPGNPYPNWKFKALIQITNPVNIANFQHKLTLTWQPGMSDDFKDIRFAQLDGIKCNYYIESYTARTTATVWIKVPSTSQQFVKLYYGNGQAVSESSGSNTFVVFDDFSSNTIGTKWTADKAGLYSNYMNIAVENGSLHTYQLTAADRGASFKLTSGLSSHITSTINLTYDTRNGRSPPYTFFYIGNNTSSRWDFGYLGSIS